MSSCPICGGDGCRTYPLMIERWTAGRDRAHWRAIHDRLNGQPGEGYPPFATMAGNAARAAAGFVADGFRVVSEEEQERRMAICRGCEHFDPEHGRCRLCGCVAALKTRIASQHCPDDPPKW